MLCVVLLLCVVLCARLLLATQVGQVPGLTQVTLNFHYRLHPSPQHLPLCTHSTHTTTCVASQPNPLGRERTHPLPLYSTPPTTTHLATWPPTTPKQPRYLIRKLPGPERQAFQAPSTAVCVACPPDSNQQLLAVRKTAQTTSVQLAIVKVSFAAHRRRNEGGSEVTHSLSTT